METSFQLLFEQWPWDPIPNCPGRYVFRGGPIPLSARELLGQDPPFGVHRFNGKRDPVEVAILADGSGLISYVKNEHHFLHTLNTVQGMARKLASLGIVTTLLRR